MKGLFTNGSLAIAKEIEKALASFPERLRVASSQIQDMLKIACPP